jgi:alginate O-acetyltransferase complex protein AlgI
VLFNSLHFLVFFPVVVVAFFATPARYRWILLLAASYYFYASWEVVYALLLAATTLVDYVAAVAMSRASSPRRRRLWLLLSLTGNVGMLAYFKYAGFLADSLSAALAPLGLDLRLSGAFHPLLPVGISFYTFQSLAYTIDVYRDEIPAERHLGIFALYVSFFPQLVAGPIERAKSLLPQFREVQRFDGGRIVSGLTIMAWGFFQKLVIADRLAPYVNHAFATGEPQTAGEVMLAAYFFYFQIYADFSGYTDIAIGAARVMGFSLMENFDRAYLSTTISQVWRRWHISLMSWFRDYLMRPLGWSRPGRAKWVRNVLIVFVASGLWHGAAWTFVSWGAYNGLMVAVGESTRRRRDRLFSSLQAAVHRFRPGAGAALAMLRITLAWALVFNLQCLGLILFRAPTLRRAGEMFRTLFTSPETLLSLNELPLPRWELLVAAAAIALFVLVDWGSRSRSWSEGLDAWPRWVRWSMAYALVSAVLMFGSFNAVEFFYFQF